MEQLLMIVNLSSIVVLLICGLLALLLLLPSFSEVIEAVGTANSSLSEELLPDNNDKGHDGWKYVSGSGEVVGRLYYKRASTKDKKIIAYTVATLHITDDNYKIDKEVERSLLVALIEHARGKDMDFDTTTTVTIDLGDASVVACDTVRDHLRNGLLGALKFQQTEDGKELYTLTLKWAVAKMDAAQLEYVSQMGIHSCSDQGDAGYWCLDGYGIVGYFRYLKESEPSEQSCADTRVFGLTFVHVIRLEHRRKGVQSTLSKAILDEMLTQVKKCNTISPNRPRGTDLVLLGITPDMYYGTDEAIGMAGTLTEAKQRRDASVQAMGSHWQKDFGFEFVDRNGCRERPHAGCEMVLCLADIAIETTSRDDHNGEELPPHEWSLKKLVEKSSYDFKEDKCKPT